jgi:antirestriction protein ArdC
VFLPQPVPFRLPRAQLARQFGKRFGDSAYAFEELVAELTAAFLCAELEIQGRLQHPEYIGIGLRCLRANNKAIWTASHRTPSSRIAFRV